MASTYYSGDGSSDVEQPQDGHGSFCSQVSFETAYCMRVGRCIFKAGPAGLCKGCNKFVS